MWNVTFPLDFFCTFLNACNTQKHVLNAISEKKQNKKTNNIDYIRVDFIKVCITNVLINILYYTYVLKFFI